MSVSRVIGLYGILQYLACTYRESRSEASIQMNFSTYASATISMFCGGSESDAFLPFTEARANTIQAGT